MTKGASWSVRVLAEPEEERAMLDVVSEMFGQIDALRMSFGTLERGNFDGPGAITIDVFDAQSDADARIKVLHFLGEVRRRAGLPVVEMPVIWVAPLATGKESSHRFL